SVEEERLFAAAELVNVLNRVVADGVGVVEIVVPAHADGRIIAGERIGREVAGGARDCSEIFFKSPLQRPVVLIDSYRGSKMPFACHCGTVSAGAQGLGDGHAAAA